MRTKEEIDEEINKLLAYKNSGKFKASQIKILNAQINVLNWVKED